MMELNLDRFSEWLGRYFQAWVSNDPEEVASLFSEDAVYYYGPFTEPYRGRKTIVDRWVANPGGQFDIKTQHEAIAVQGNVGVAHWNVKFRSQANLAKVNELDGILMLRFNSMLECNEHREWYSHREIESPETTAF